MRDSSGEVVQRKAEFGGGIEQSIWNSIPIDSALNELGFSDLGSRSVSSVAKWVRRFSSEKERCAKLARTKASF